METTQEVISDEELEAVHFGNFGSASKRHVVDRGVLTYAFGFTSGYTVLSILISHGLVRRPRPGSYVTDLTKKGKRYLRAMCGGAPLSTILEAMDGAEIS